MVTILAGGESRRMGTDKASLIRDGETFLERTTRLAQAVSRLPPLIVGRDRPGDWRGLPAEFIPDDLSGIGPIGGLRTALRHAGNLPLLVLSCDLPALTDEALVWLFEQRRNEYGVVTRNGEQMEPLFAIYLPASISLIDTNISAGKGSLHALIRAGEGKFQIADVPSELAPALANVNTPEQWATFQGR